jgi:hypothetical protein
MIQRLPIQRNRRYPLNVFTTDYRPICNIIACAVTEQQIALVCSTVACYTYLNVEYKKDFFYIIAKKSEK